MMMKNETKESRRNYMTATDVAREIGCGKSCAAKYIRKMNQELERKGFLIAPGRVPRRYFVERFGLAEG